MYEHDLEGKKRKVKYRYVGGWYASVPQKVRTSRAASSAALRNGFPLARCEIFVRLPFMTVFRGHGLRKLRFEQKS